MSHPHKHKIEGEPAFVLHRYDWSESSLILDLFTREQGRVAVAAKGANNVALITGEERIVPPRPRYYVCTVEAMPLDLKTDFLAVDEVFRLAAREPFTPDGLYVLCRYGEMSGLG